MLPFRVFTGSNRAASIFPVASLVLLTVATVLSVVGNIKRDFKTLVSAVTYILAGKTGNNHFSWVYLFHWADSNGTT